jgi:hypothetical protein
MMMIISPMILPNALYTKLNRFKSPSMTTTQHNHDHHLQRQSYLKVATLSLFMAMTSDENSPSSSLLLPQRTDMDAKKNNDFDTENVNDTYPCRSNSTHIVWYTSSVNNDSDEDDSIRFTCTWQTIHNAKIDAYQYLRQNIMSFDIPFLETLGFHDDDNDTDDDDNNNSNTDGLTNGMIGPVIDLSFITKIKFQYTDIVPKAIFYEYVLNYANVNENRNNIRPYIYEYLVQPLFFPKSTTTTTTTTTSSHPEQLPEQNYTMTEAIRTINANMWRMLAPSKHTDCIRFVSGQTPIIFDPMSVLTFGYGSCTGISILLVQALRAAGIPSRLAGTPAWNQNIQHGNHNWVEVWLPNMVPPHNQHLLAITGVQLNPTTHAALVKANAMSDSNQNNGENNDYGGIWLFIEGSPNMTTVDGIDDWWNPCEHFLCDHDRLINQTQYFAATLDKNTTTYFPLAWDISNQDVPAINRTLFYHTICGQCK